MYTPFWFKQFDILYDKQYIFEIFPMKDYDTIRKLNAIVRFSILYSVIIYLYKRKEDIFAIPIIVGIISYVVWSKTTDIQKNEFQNNLMNNKVEESTSDDLSSCMLPTKDNPFMNTSFIDVAANKELPEPCTSYNNKGVQQKIEKEFDKGLYRNYTDIFGKENSQRQFYTIPGKRGIPEMDKFARWLYQTPKTCKEGNGLACLSVGTMGSASPGTSL